MEPDSITNTQSSPHNGRVDLRDSQGSSSAQIVIGGKATTLVIVLLSILLALDIAAQVARFMKDAQLDKAAHDQETENRLAQYNMDFFRTHEFAALEVKVGLIEKLIPTNCKR